jgi:hypothetical protein
VANLEPGALYLLAAKSTPEQVRDDILSRVEKGEKLAVKEIREIVTAAKPKREAVTPRADPGWLTPPTQTIDPISQDLSRLIHAWDNACEAARRKFLSLRNLNVEQPIPAMELAALRDAPKEPEPESAPDPNASSVTDAVIAPEPEPVDASACRYLKCRDAGRCLFPQQCPPSVRSANRVAF